MRWTVRVACIVALLFGAPAFAGPLGQKAAVAENKAEVLEEQAAEQGASGTAAQVRPITRSEARAVDPAGEAPLDDAITCLARSVYWEAKGASRGDMEAVANVVMNRVASKDFPDTVCAVVKQGSESKSCQFSWWCDGRPDQVVEEKRYDLARDIARKALNRQLPDRTDGALYFHDRHVRPSWARTYLRTARTEHFLFYKPRLGGEPIARSGAGRRP
ncbi:MULTISPECIES: cell wall hydrolase [unclassified Pseudomonas]|jgi:spore germination cell wall hydrolase CwlJ-like protein|uniref:cell wall hydrolase n=1 Tax=unclassified Pseudomonas TaxID=196821 RepID=UPI0007300E2E|nr:MULTISPECIES: cell wall hydrolase [unclassified Pseudomonas]KSW27744.1 hydrolase [Pseudomonas sp. ADP]OBP11294.1 hydrolase [Pseudomonas sp. EGD-AKN5]QOF84410.1 cell wall hydrolase [Pseudomonas sp. ADPe]